MDPMTGGGADPVANAGGKAVLKRRLADAAWAVPLILVYGAVIFGLLRGMPAEFAAIASGPRLPVVLMIGQETATIAFAALQIALFLGRALPLRKADGILPRAVAIMGSNAGFLFLLLPRVTQGPFLLAASTLTITVGLAASFVSAAFLGRAFSVMPQARGFVSRGPYRYIRHPLYLSEQITAFGICCQFVQPWSLLLACASLGAQILRMHYEENVLSETFPAYRDYMQRTARLVPGVY